MSKGPAMAVEGTHTETDAASVVDLLTGSRDVIIVPGKSADTLSISALGNPLVAEPPCQGSVAWEGQGLTLGRVTCLVRSSGIRSRVVPSQMSDSHQAAHSTPAER